MCSTLVDSPPATEYQTPGIALLRAHLCFKQAKPKMCHSPKVEDGVEINFFNFLDAYFWQFFNKKLRIAINHKRLELLP